MVTVDKAIVARLDRDGKHFEILVDSEMAYALKEGKIVSIGKMLAANQIFTDAKKGMKTGTSDLDVVFKTQDVEKIVPVIIKDGDLQLTTDFRRKKVEEKRKQIITQISKGAVDPRTKLPHPPERIENAMNEARVNIDPFRPAESQLSDVVKQIKSVIPLSFEEIEITAEIPAKYSNQIYGVIQKEFGSFQEQWLGDRMIIKIKIPAAVKESFFRRINGLTEGNARVS
ncbi:MAG: ribosome assembly factor SBDS [Candidatus Aenigmarchaeota archaeon]|nr:ribosome assembly factor SBDS [Candidatus Aenigmarchaeota archaeon]